MIVAMSTLPLKLAQGGAHGTAACPWVGARAFGPALRLHDYPSTMLLRLAQAIQQKVSASYAQAHGLSSTEWRLLARLSQGKPFTWR